MWAGQVENRHLRHSGVSEGQHATWRFYQLRQSIALELMQAIWRQATQRREQLRLYVQIHTWCQLVGAIVSRPNTVCTAVSIVVGGTPLATPSPFRACSRSSVMVALLVLSASSSRAGDDDTGLLAVSLAEGSVSTIVLCTPRSVVLEPTGWDCEWSGAIPRAQNELQFQLEGHATRSERGGVRARGRENVVIVFIYRYKFTSRRHSAYASLRVLA